jgi:hypothetical protein
MQKPPGALFTFRVSLLQMPKKCIHCQYARLVSKTRPCLRRSECDTNKKLRAHNQRKKAQRADAEMHRNIYFLEKFQS